MAYEKYQEIKKTTFCSFPHPRMETPWQLLSCVLAESRWPGISIVRGFYEGFVSHERVNQNKKHN